jgi:predicted ribosome quality control (RQC) complex YloA/Tae2 family protein
VTIDCPADCPHLVASRKYDEGRRLVDWSNIPFSDVRISNEFAQSHALLLMTLISSIWKYAREYRQVVDADVIAALQALAESYRTLSSGLYYEKPPDYLYQRELYQVLKTALEEFQRVQTQRQGLVTIRNSDLRDSLIYLTQLGALRTNGRPKGRAFLDLIRSQVAPQDSAQANSNIVLLR